VTDRLAVLLDDAIAGTLRRLPGGRLRFDYDDDYRKRPSPTPLSISMPVQVQSHSDQAVTPWLWGLLPDNEAVLAALGPRVPRISVFAVLDACDGNRPRLRRRSALCPA